MSPRKPLAPVFPDPVTYDDAGDPEPSILEVERMLALADASEEIASGAPLPIPPAEAAMEVVAATLPDSLPEGHEICLECGGSGHVRAASGWVQSRAGEPHALDLAPDNSKIVVVLLDGKSHAVIAGPEGAKELPVGDIAHRLPEGARIQKLPDRQGFRATQLSAVEDHPDRTYATAGAAIAGFLEHFHPPGRPS